MPAVSMLPQGDSLGIPKWFGHFCGGGVMRLKVFVLCCALLLVGAISMRSANASVLQFEVSGAGQFTFLLDSNPDGFDGVTAFYVTNIPNTSSYPVFEVLAFFTSDAGGGLLATPFFTEDPDIPYFNLFGTQLFTGTASDAMFFPGVFNLTDGNNEQYLLTITSVPELSTWVMMIVGFVVIGVMTHQSRKVAKMNVRAVRLLRKSSDNALS
jgi:hypothetical protein